MSSTAPPRPYKCSECTRAFTTRRALKDHGESTRHIFPCSIPSCTKVFLSEPARTAHLASSAHASKKMRAGIVPVPSVVTFVTSPVQQSTMVESSKRSLPCTEPGCQRMFKTSPALLQHRNAAHDSKRDSLTEGKQNTKPAVSTNQCKAATSSAAAQPAPTPGQETMRSGVIDAGKIATVQNGVDTSPHKRAAQASKSLPKRTHQEKCASLFRWNTRWTTVNTSAHTSILIGLQARLPTPEMLSSVRVDKDFWTRDQKRAPAQVAASYKRRAIALDCEMVGIGPKGKTSELARLSAIDFLTGELLIDSLVRPEWDVTDWRTRWSGITAKMMETAVISGHALKGSTAARAALFDHMDSQTVLIGHALHYDLAALGIRHDVTVDSSVLAKMAVGKRVKRDWGLKILCKELLGITIQDSGKDGHDAVEDALAAREVVLWCLQHGEELKRWGARKKKEYYANGNKSTGKQKPQRRARTPQYWDFSDSNSDEYRNLSLAEFNELCGYPPEYDNWSD